MSIKETLSPSIKYGSKRAYPRPAKKNSSTNANHIRRLNLSLANRPQGSTNRQQWHHRASTLQNITRQILILDDGRHLLPHILRIDHDHLFNTIRGLTLNDGQRR